MGSASRPNLTRARKVHSAKPAQPRRKPAPKPGPDLNGILDRFDHTYLNDVVDNPTAELIAADIWKRLEATEWGGAPLRLAGLRLWETQDSSVELLP